MDIRIHQVVQFKGRLATIKSICGKSIVIKLISDGEEQNCTSSSIETPKLFGMFDQGMVQLLVRCGGLYYFVNNDLTLLSDSPVQLPDGIVYELKDVVEEKIKPGDCILKASENWTDSAIVIMDETGRETILSHIGENGYSKMFFICHIDPQ